MQKTARTAILVLLAFVPLVARSDVSGDWMLTTHDPFNPQIARVFFREPRFAFSFRWPSGTDPADVVEPPFHAAIPENGTDQPFVNPRTGKSPVVNR